MATRGTIIGTGAYLLPGGAKQFVLALIDLDAATPEPKLIGMRFLGHGVAIDPTMPTQAAIFEKRGPGACVVDLTTGVCLSIISTPKNRQFYGHGAFSADGSKLYATESVLDEERRGLLVVRDGQSHEELGELPTHGTAPHDCMLLDDGTTMMVANGGGRAGEPGVPCITFVDIDSGKLLEKVEVPDARFNAGHVARSSAGDLAIVSAPRDGLPDLHRQRGGLTLVRAGEAPNVVSEPQAVVDRMLGETLSVWLQEPEGTVFATQPDGDMVSVWSMADGAFLETLEFSGPRGVALSLDGEVLIVSHVLDKSVALTLLDARTRRPLEGDPIAPSFTSGSHLFVHDLPQAN